jgi:hypothetical protein
VAQYLADARLAEVHSEPPRRRAATVVSD